jgi:hypothetical protein
MVLSAGFNLHGSHWLVQITDWIIREDETVYWLTVFYFSLFFLLSNVLRDGKMQTSRGQEFIGPWISI